jgi:hypothetical protein
MNLTDEQFGLIEVLVSNFESTGVADFCFTRSATGGGLSYEGASSVPGVYDAPDLHQLEREGLITLSTTSPTTFHCRLTQQGITVVHRKLTQQLFRNLTATYVPEGLKPGGMQFVYFGEAGAAASKEAESTECLQNGGVGPLMHHTISIPNIDINDYPSDLDDAELDQVKAAEIRGARAITLKKQLVRSTGEMETLLLRDWVLPIFAAFSTVAINRAKVGSWSG